MKKILTVLIIISSITSCRMQKDVLYFTNLSSVINESEEVYEDPRIQTGDALSIIVSAFDETLARPFNLSRPEGMGTASGGGTGAQNPTNYVVASNGEIEMPMLGSIQVLGKTRQELATYVNHARAVAYLPFREDSFGYVTMEAFEAAKPVITVSDAGELLEIVLDDQTGTVTAPEPRLLGDAMSAYCRDERLACDRGRAGQALWRSKGINWPENISRLLGN